MRIENVKVYLQESTIHGIRYFVDGENLLHKLCWVAIVLCSLSLVSVLFVNGFRDWDENPSISNVEKVPIRELAHPAVTVCPDGHTPWLAYQHILNHVELDETVKADIPQSLNTAIKAAARSLVLEYRDSTMEYRQMEYYSIFSDFLEELPDLGIADSEKMKRYDSKFDEWMFRMDVYYKSDCEGDAKYCNFHQAIMNFYESIDEEQFKQWAFQNQVPVMYSPGLVFNVEPNVIDLMRALTDDFISNNNVFGLTKEENIQEYLSFLEQGDFSRIKGWSDPPGIPGKKRKKRQMKGDGGPPIKRVSRPQPCEVSDGWFPGKSVSADQEKANVYQDYIQLILAYADHMESLITQLEAAGPLCPNEESILVDSDFGTILGSIYSLEKSLANISPEIMPTMLNITQLNDKFERNIEIITAKQECLMPQKFPPKVLEVNREKVEKLKENFKIMNYGDGIGFYVAWNDDGSCIKYPIPGDFCYSEHDEGPRRSEDYYSKTCTCRCEKKHQLNTFIIFKLFERMSKNVGNLGTFMSWFSGYEKKSQLEFSDMLTDPGYENYTEAWIGMYGDVSHQIRYDSLLSMREELHNFDRKLLKELFDTDLDVGLFEYINDMSMPVSNTAQFSNGYFPRLPNMPSEARREVFRLFTYSEFLPSLFQWKTTTVPDFENVDSKPFNKICEDPKFKNYCSLSENNLDLQSIFKLMKFATHPRLYADNGVQLNNKIYKDSATTENHKLSLTPICWFAQNASTLKSPEFPVDMVNFFDDRELAEEEGRKYYKTPVPDIYRYNKCPQFQTTPTDLGLCQTFNGLPINKILKGSDWLTKFTEEFETAEDKPIHNAYGIGEDKGFVFVVDNMYSPKLTRVKPGTAKFWIKVHDPGNIPRLGDEDLSNWIPIQTEQTGFLTNVDLKVHGEFSSSTQDFKDISIDIRKCMFSNEGSLQLFDHYSEPNCQMECLWKKGFDVCGCKPWFIPTLDGEKTCFYLGNICFQAIVEKYQTEEENKKLNCECLQSCETSEYTLSLGSRNKENIVSYCVQHGLDCNRQWGLETVGKFYTTLKWNAGSIIEGTWFNLANYILDPRNLIHASEDTLANVDEVNIDFDCSKIDNGICSRRIDNSYKDEELFQRKSGMFTISLSFPTDQKSIAKITKDSKMKFSDKISWIGGNLGLFTGFSIISGFEILYWLIFKVIFHKKDKKVEPNSFFIRDRQDSSPDISACDKCGERIEKLEKEHAELKALIMGGQQKGADQDWTEDTSKIAFDAIFCSPDDKINKSQLSMKEEVNMECKDELVEVESATT